MYDSAGSSGHESTDTIEEMTENDEDDGLTRREVLAGRQKKAAAVDASQCRTARGEAHMMMKMTVKSAG